MTQINNFQESKLLNRVTKAPLNHTFVPIQISFDVKFDLHSMTQIVAWGDITWSRDRGYYFGVVNIGIVRDDLFFGYLNNLEVTDTYVGNSYQHRFTSFALNFLSYNISMVPSKNVVCTRIYYIEPDIHGLRTTRKNLVLVDWFRATLYT